jgi:hypothetical protein
MARQVARPVQDSPGGLLMSLFGDDPSLFADPFAAVLPFAAGSSRIAPGRHRAMALDVLEVRTCPSRECSAPHCRSRPGNVPERAPTAAQLTQSSVVQNDKTIEVLADIPGVKKEDIHVRCRFTRPGC